MSYQNILIVGFPMTGTKLVKNIIVNSFESIFRYALKCIYQDIWSGQGSGVG